MIALPLLATPLRYPYMAQRLYAHQLPMAIPWKLLDRAYTVFNFMKSALSFFELHPKAHISITGACIVLCYLGLTY